MDIGISNPLSSITAGSKSPAGAGSTDTALPPRVVSSPESSFPATLSRQAERSEESLREPVEKAMASIQGFVQAIRRDLNFALDEASGRVVVKVTDAVSGDVIRQIPSEDALKLAESLEDVRSLLFKAEA